MIPTNHCGRIETAYTRRELLGRAGGGIGALALGSLLQSQGLAANANLGPNQLLGTLICGVGFMGRAERRMEGGAEIDSVGSWRRS